MTASPDSLLGRMRAATRVLHERLESKTLGNKIMEGTLTVPEYHRLVRWQERVHHTLEPQLAKFTVGGYRYRPRFADGDASVPPAALPEALGLAYVLEGSSLGGSMIYQKLRANPALASEAPFSFYRGQAETGVKQWRALARELGRLELSEAETERAAESARRAFLRFEQEWEAA